MGAMAAPAARRGTSLEEGRQLWAFHPLKRPPTPAVRETGWVRPRGRRKAPGRPLPYGTSEELLSHFGLEQLSDLPGLDELKATGLLDGRMPANFSIPMPSDDPALRDDEDPLEPGDLDLGLAPRVTPEE